MGAQFFNDRREYKRGFALVEDVRTFMIEESHS
jgi:hypothetical protein